MREKVITQKYQIAQKVWIGEYVTTEKGLCPSCQGYPNIWRGSVRFKCDTCDGNSRAAGCNKIYAPVQTRIHLIEINRNDEVRYVVANSGGFPESPLFTDIEKCQSWCDKKNQKLSSPAPTGDKSDEG